MGMKEKLRAVFALSAILCLPGCGKIHYPSVNDLTLVSVDVLQQSQIPGHDKFWGPGVISDPLFRVKISTQADFQKLARNWGYNVDNRASICTDNSIDDTKRLGGFPSVYDRYGMIYSFHSEHPDSRIGQQPRTVYWVYFDVRDMDNVNFYHYDLAKKPEDICLQIAGLQEVEGDFALASFRSNTIVVSRAAIAAAIDRAKIKL